MLSEAEFIRSLADVNFKGRGPKALRLFEVKDEFFKRLKAELVELTERYSPSLVQDHGHATNWTNPFGAAVQFSLLNRSGRVNDTSTDHNLSVAGKSFHYPKEFPTLDGFIRTFPHAVNMRLNGMGQKSGLSPHEENVVHWCGLRSPARFFVRARFHLPIQTNPKAMLLLDGETFHFEERFVYFFNNGAVHSANNLGDTYRYHLVWDMLLSRAAFSLMFGHAPVPTFLERVPESRREVAPSASVNVEDYALSGLELRLYRLMQLKRVGISQGQFHSKIYGPIARRAPIRIGFAEPR
jgi:aspartyl/asparaginyl beta-hydroxylase